MEMKPTILIHPDRCIRCGKCARVCPDGILQQESPKAAIQVARAEHCIGCGHCVDVCPEQALEHSLFPAEKIHPIDYALMPSAQQVMALLQARRSNRTLTGKPIPMEVLKQVVEAANYAPTATNSQLLSYTLVTDPARIRKTDPGHPDICAVYAYQGFYNKEKQEEICENCKKGCIGCGECKKMLTDKIHAFLDPIREKRAFYEANPQLLDDIIDSGNTAARKVACNTMEMVREAIKI